MPEQGNIARRYAQAVFELAREQGDLAGWSEQLDLLAAIAADAATRQLLHDPKVPSEQMAELFRRVGAERLSAAADNLVKLLLYHGRVDALPAIAEAYKARRAQAEQVVAAEMTTASEVDPQQRQQFVAALQKKLGRTVELAFAVDRGLIGGAVIRVGDRVVDGSVKAQLEQLAEAMGG